MLDFLPVDGTGARQQGQLFDFAGAGALARNSDYYMRQEALSTARIMTVAAVIYYNVDYKIYSYMPGCA
jgi:hypothetical protein